MEKKKLNISHNLMGCRFDNWMRLIHENPITPENKKQVRFMSVVSFVLGMADLLYSY